MKATKFGVIMFILTSCALGTKFVDTSPGGWIHVHTKAFYIFKSMTAIMDREKRYIVCLESPSEKVQEHQKRVKNALENFSFYEPMVDDDVYLYILVREDKLVSFFRMISTKWSKESSLSDDVIEFRKFSTPVYIVNDGGIELRHNKGEYIPTNIFISKTQGFQELYQHEVSETPIAPSLTHIEQIFLEQQSGEMSKDEEQ